MRTAGVIFVALGIMFLIISFFPIVLAENSTQLFLGIGCVAFIALPLIFIGSYLTRRAAAKSGPEGEAAASAALTQIAGSVLGFLSAGRTQVGTADPHGFPMDRFRAFDLNSITRLGWLLVIASFGFLLGEVLLFHRLVLKDRKDDLGPVGGFLFFGGLLLSIAFFCVGKWLMNAFGVPFSIAVDSPPDRACQQDQATDRDEPEW